ncbi:hypothetical protein [Zobellia laminariae]|uniref:hypothetical protein n=1 Tax=Zobellia laminariae TaxID=248906 RepID=UPI0026F46782|nr:hypothetical protein [Zobellia laminariae]WKX75880.1 hypothetical protein Q5W13_20160 [Zobellia laminariae]
MEKVKIIELIKKAENLTPKKLERDLEPLDGFPDVPNWHKYESEIWEIGEEIRQIINTKKSLRKDSELTDLIMKFCLNKNSKRGRQSFILLLGYKHLSKYATQLIEMLNDKFVKGQIIDTVYKMQAEGFQKEIGAFMMDKHTWIRKLATKYVEKYGTQQRL